MQATESWFVSSLIGTVFFVLFTLSAVTDRRIATIHHWLGQERWAFWQIISGVLFTLGFLDFTLVGHIALTDDSPDSNTPLVWILVGGNISWTLGGAVMWLARYRAINEAISGGARGEDSGAEIRDVAGVEQTLEHVDEVTTDTQERVARIEETIIPPKE